MFFSPKPQSHRRQLELSERRLLLMLGDISAVILAILIALWVWTRVAGYGFDAPFIASQAVWFLLLPALWLLLASVNDFYDLKVAASRQKTMIRLMLITIQIGVVYLVVFFLAPVGELPRLFIFYYAIGSFVLLALWRLTRPFLLGWVSERRHTLIIGTNWSAETIINAIRDHAESAYDVRGIISAGDHPIGDSVAGVQVVGGADELAAIIERNQISELIVTETAGLSGALFQSVMDAYDRGITITPMALLYERITGRVPVEHVNDDWAVILLPIKNTDALFDPYPMLKRMIDLALAIIGLIAFIVILPLVALAIRIDSAGGIFYAQDRVGRNGRIFRLYKLRTMRPDAEAGVGEVFSTRGDPRVTRIGRLLRKTRLDEVPQLLNVLRGDMSMVGPRPERPGHVERLSQKIPFYRTRLIVRPGLTGWAQVRFGYGETDEHALTKLQYDLYYIRHQSVLLDTLILLRTVGKVASMSGI